MSSSAEPAPASHPLPPLLPPDGAAGVSGALVTAVSASFTFIVCVYLCMPTL
jgi:hypothetical protein